MQDAHCSASVNEFALFELKTMPIHIIRICHSEVTDSSGGIACLTTDFHLGRAASYTDLKFPPPTMLMEK